MRKIVTFLGAAGALLLAVAPAGAQGVQFRFGADDGYQRTQYRDLDREERRAERRRERFEDRGDRFEERGPRFGSRIVEERLIERRRPVVVEERVIRRPPRARTVCTTRVRERITPGGVIVRRPVEVCRQVIGTGPQF